VADVLCDAGLLWFSDDIEQMLGIRPNVYWQFCWSIAAPLLILVCVINSDKNSVTSGFCSTCVGDIDSYCGQ